MTKQRKLVLDIIRSSKRHLSAQEIFEIAKEQIPSIVRATVYNNLQALAASGDIVRIPMANAPDRYDKTTAPHYHMVCECCGTMEDMVCPDLISYFKRFNQADIRSLEVTARYICAPCRMATEHN